MLLTNQRLDKLAAARVDFVNRGMLDSNRLQYPGPIQIPAPKGRGSDDEGDEGELQPEAGPSVTPHLAARVLMVTGNVTLARTRSMSFP